MEINNDFGLEFETTSDKETTKLRVREKFVSQAAKLLAHFTNDICSEQECSREGYISAQSIFLYIIYCYKEDTVI